MTKDSKLQRIMSIFAPLAIKVLYPFSAIIDSFLTPKMNLLAAHASLRLHHVQGLSLADHAFPGPNPPAGHP